MGLDVAGGDVDVFFCLVYVTCIFLPFDVDGAGGIDGSVGGGIDVAGGDVDGFFCLLDFTCIFLPSDVDGSGGGGIDVAGGNVDVLFRLLDFFGVNLPISDTVTSSIVIHMIYFFGYNNTN
jgi:hypothetical protein